MRSLSRTEGVHHGRSLHHARSVHHVPLAERIGPKEKSTAFAVLFLLEATPGFEPGDKGFADLCLTTWLCRLMNQPLSSLCRPSYQNDLYIILRTLRNAY